jgi:hypothetical protein
MSSTPVSALTRSVFDNEIVGSELANIPSIYNLKREDFPDYTEDKYIARSFIQPLSNDTELYQDVELLIDIDDTERFVCTRRDDGMQFPGLSIDVGEGKSANALNVMYTSKEDDKKTLMKYAYNPDLFLACGIYDNERWKQCAARILFMAKDCFVYGYTTIEKLEAIGANSDAEMADTDQIFSTGFVTKMAVDMAKTAKAAGVEVSHDYVANHFGPDSDYSNSTEHSGTHILNSGWKVKAKKNSSYCFNLTDMQEEQIASLLKETKDRETVKFYGIFASDDVYEAATDEEKEAALAANVPVTVFAVNTK